MPPPFPIFFIISGKRPPVNHIVRIIIILAQIIPDTEFIFIPKGKDPLERPFLL